MGWGVQQIKKTNPQKKQLCINIWNTLLWARRAPQALHWRYFDFFFINCIYLAYTNLGLQDQTIFTL